jgi:hypothetical protein
MSANDDAYLTALREHAAETRILLSNRQKPERERMIVRAFLRCIGTTFTENEILASTEEPVDVHFRAARFQIMEIVGDRKRGKDWAEREQHYREAKSVSDVMEVYSASIPYSLDEAARMVTDALATKARHYGRGTCAALDALVYIDLRNSHLWPPEPRDLSGISADLRQQGWRSVSMLSLPYGAVVAATASAPDLLASKLDLVLSEWPGPDGWFEP